MTNAQESITVRAPRPGDLAEVMAMEDRCFGDPWSAEALEQELVPDRLRYPLIAEISGQVVGYLMAWKIVDQLHLLNIATDPEFQRKGVATALLLAAARRAAAWGLIEITLEVRESNLAARAFYARHGFLPRGLRRGYYVDNGEDAIVMTRRIEGLIPEES
jgi:ribosomal-protein-alanine N-acetyltransferase